MLTRPDHSTLRPSHNAKVCHKDEVMKFCFFSNSYVHNLITSLISAINYPVTERQKEFYHIQNPM